LSPYSNVMAGTKYVDFVGGAVVLSRNMIGTPSSTERIFYDRLLEFKDKDGYNCFGLIQNGDPEQGPLLRVFPKVDATVYVGRTHDQVASGMYVLGQLTQAEATGLSNTIREHLDPNVSFAVRPAA